MHSALVREKGAQTLAVHNRVEQFADLVHHRSIHCILLPGVNGFRRRYFTAKRKAKTSDIRRTHRGGDGVDSGLDRLRPFSVGDRRHACLRKPFDRRQSR
jgi:hypothetical protein